MKLPSESLESFFKLRDSGVILKQELKRLQEIAVMIVLCLMIERVHFVRRRGKEQDTRSPLDCRAAALAVAEQISRQLGSLILVFLIQQILESLELVKNNQIRLKGPDTDLSEQ